MMNRKYAPIISIVVPCYNEEEVLLETTGRLNGKLAEMIDKSKISSDSRIYYIDDGSSDGTWRQIQEIHNSYPNVYGVKLAANVGHQNALIAGLSVAEGDALISIDADLQDDIDIMEKMVDLFVNENIDIVYGVRNKRDTDTAFKRWTAQSFYRFMRVMGVEIYENHADFRLMGRSAIQALKKFEEVNLFLRGIVPLIGFKSSIVYYERRPRTAGTSKYPISKMISLAVEGITSFSVMPLRIIALIGFITFTLSCLIGLWAFLAALFSDSAVPGWASTVLPIYFLGGIQLLGLGVIGEYIGKVYQEVKRRPRFIVEKMLQ